MVKGVCIIPNWQKSNTPAVIAAVKEFFDASGIPVVRIIREEEGAGLGNLACILEDWQEKISMIIVVGGDGTILRVARDLACWELPILGINVGNMGFLAELEVNDIPHYLENVLSGNYDIIKRVMLRAEVIRRGKRVADFTALNDVVVTKGAFSRVIHLDVHVSETFFDSYKGDGVIIATPTGSTGYSLSAGGPIIVPGLEILLITPICPHSLYNRSVIVDANETVQIDICTPKSDIVLTLDGQTGFALEEQDRVYIARSPVHAKLVTFYNRSYFNILRKKLKE